MPYYVGKVVDDIKQVIARTPQAFREKLGIDVRTRSEVEEIDLKKRRVRVRPADGGSEYYETFDKLLIATGAAPIRPAVPGIDLPGVYGVATLEDGVRIRQALEADKPRQAVVVGGGYIGLEMAEALLLHGLEVAVVDMLPQVMGTLDPDMAALVAEGLGNLGVNLHLGETLQGFEARAGRLAAVRTDKRELPAEIAILGLGVRPNSALAKGAGLTLGEKGAIRVNDRLETGTDGVWAAGDCAESFHLVSLKPIHIALGTVANKHGRVAGINMSGGNARFPGVVGTAVTKVYQLEIARTGLQEREAQVLGLDYARARIDGHTRAPYYPGAGRMTVKLVGEKGSGRLLGGQIVGREGSGKRIDTVATALHAAMCVDDLVNLDLAYAPPFSSAWDPVQVAARQLLRLL